MKVFIPLECLSLAFVKLETQSMSLRYDSHNLIMYNVSFSFTTKDLESIITIQNQLTNLESRLLETYQNKSFILQNYELEIGNNYFCSCYEIKENDSNFFIHFDMITNKI